MKAQSLVVLIVYLKNTKKWLSRHRADGRKRYEEFLEEELLLPKKVQSQSKKVVKSNPLQCQPSCSFAAVSSDPGKQLHDAHQKVRDVEQAATKQKLDFDKLKKSCASTLALKVSRSLNKNLSCEIRMLKKKLQKKNNALKTLRNQNARLRRQLARRNDKMKDLSQQITSEQEQRMELDDMLFESREELKTSNF